MEKRLPIALVLSLLFLLWYLGQFQPPPDAQGGNGGGGESVAAGDREPGESGGGAPAGGSGAPTGGDSRAEGGAAGDRSDDGGGGPPAGALVTDAPEVELGLDTGDTTSLWTSRGAAVVSMDLTDYKVSPTDPEPLPILGELDQRTPNLLLRDLNGRYGLDEAHWAVEEKETVDGLPRLVFTLQTADGLLFTRTVTAQPHVDRPHTLRLELEVQNVGDARTQPLSLALQSARGVVDEEAGSQFYGAPTALAVVRKGTNDPEVVRWSGDDLRGESRRINEGERLLAAGCMTNYFASLLVPDADTQVGQVYPLPVTDRLKLERKVAEQAPLDEYAAEQARADLAGSVPPNGAVDLELWVPRLDPGQSQSFGFELYNGPKALEAAGLPGYDWLLPVIESTYGSWAWINRTLLQILRFFHGLVGNWGAAIILLTLLVKAILFPLNRRQQTSMAKYSAVMTKLKPQLDELKAKYKNNMKKFNEEQMKLLRAEGASPPLGGCLLMFLQFPIWISLFQILGTSIELRQSHFVFWINDLSRPDAMPFGMLGFETINLLPLLMAAATSVQMRFQAKPADPQQAQTQKIMGLFMPIIMLFFLYSYSSGLSLYIFTSSLIGIFEFQVIRRIWPVAGLPSPAAARS